MKKQFLSIEQIPAILWGEKSNKEDTVITILAEEVTAKGGQLLSFDLPEHGERHNSPYPCNVQHCIDNLALIMNKARQDYTDIGLFSCSIGAYFSLLTYNTEPLKQALFLSPVVDMEHIITQLM